MSLDSKFTTEEQQELAAMFQSSAIEMAQSGVFSFEQKKNNGEQVGEDMAVIPVCRIIAPDGKRYISYVTVSEEKHNTFAKPTGLFITIDLKEGGASVERL